MNFKRIAAVITALAAIAPLSANNEALVKQPVLAAEQPSMDSVIGTLPDWTPMNFIDAMEFYNTYGKTHVEDNFICLVKPMRSDEIDKYRTSYSGSMAMINTPACTSPAVFKLEIPEQPDPNDDEALAEYEELCNKSIWIFSGYTIEQLDQNKPGGNIEDIKSILSYVDVLVDGPFIESKKNLSLRFRGSENQRIIDMKRSIYYMKTVLWEDHSA